MDIRRTQNHDAQNLEARRKAARGLAEHGETVEHSKAAARQARARMTEARDIHRNAHDDRIELSGTAQKLAAGGFDDETGRAELVQELKAAYQNGTLNSGERIQRAASRLLGGE